MTLNKDHSENQFYLGKVDHQVSQDLPLGRESTQFLQNSKPGNVPQRRTDLHPIIPRDQEIIARTEPLVDASATTEVSSLTEELKKPLYMGEGNELWNGMRGSIR